MYGTLIRENDYIVTNGETMSMQTALQPSIYEQALLKITRTLPVERVAQLLDYARYIKLQSIKETNDFVDETEEDILVDEARWDEQFAASQDMMGSMADRVRASIRSGQSTPMVFTSEGTIEPE